MLAQCSRLLMVLLTCCLAGCGTVVPDIKEAWDSDIPARGNDVSPIPGAGQIEFEIKSKIYCELKDAVLATNHYFKDEFALPPDWIAQVSLSLQVDESAALNPGVTLNNPLATAMTTFGVLGKTPVTVMSPQMFSLGIGGTLSSTATRSDKFDPQWTIEWLSRPSITRQGVPPLCGHDPMGDPLVREHYKYNMPLPARSSPLLIESSLGIREWLLGAMYTNKAVLSVTVPSPPTKDQLAAKRKELGVEREWLAKNGFTDTEIIKIVASGASRSELLELMKSGYTTAEITQSVQSKAKAGSSGGGGGSGGASKPDTLTLEIKFVIVSSGNVTPTWKLVRVSSGTSSTPLFAIGRTRTHDVIITIGPPTDTTRNTHLASQIGVSVANSVQSSAMAPSNTFTFP
jgi:hypothetical protein